jgi:hypothetical protein
MDHCQGGTSGLSAEQFSKILIAYEPVWAIGTGKTATPEIAADAHRVIRAHASGAFGQPAANSLRILYGGSVKPDNIKGLMAQPEIDGALVGGASLDPICSPSSLIFSQVGQAVSLRVSRRGEHTKSVSTRPVASLNFVRTPPMNNLILALLFRQCLCPVSTASRYHYCFRRHRCERRHTTVPVRGIAP